MVSIMARPTKSVRETMPDASGFGEGGTDRPDRDREGRADDAEHFYGHDRSYPASPALTAPPTYTVARTVKINA
jgi:hypothetical protein